MGLGYIGLPTAIMFAKSGCHVHGVDVNPMIIDQLQAKQSNSYEPGLEDVLKEVMNEKKLTVSTHPEEADTFIIAVPTPFTVNKMSDLSHVKRAAEMIVPYVKKENLVVLESTVPPKTVEEVVLPILKQTGLDIGHELFVGYSPERVLPGNLLDEMVDNDRIVGGINQLSSEKCVALYKRFVKGNIHVTDVVTAEMVKLMENTYRNVNIAFANELARIAETIGFNVWEAIDLANSHPRVHIHKPGPGVGGHCIAVDPWFIVEKAPEESELISVAINRNDATPYHVVHVIEQMVKHITNPVVSLLGLAFKGNIDDMRESPAIVIRNELEQRGVQLKVFDPYVKQDVPGKVQTLAEAASDSDCLVLITDHDIFKTIDFSQLKDLLRTKQILDTRNMLDRQRLADLGITCLHIGTSSYKTAG